MSAAVMSNSGILSEGLVLVDEREDGFVSGPTGGRAGNEYCEVVCPLFRVVSEYLSKPITLRTPVSRSNMAGTPDTPPFSSSKQSYPWDRIDCIFALLKTR